ncbi:hypothetical protein GLOIN_2v1874127 [Rhizophagus irregularis DAOM 181602=DAOM 197198]|nr:hypothetical protein GLOIN_2v1874127 [Rhizophagus irregularis DAOM 181602=DAOM 197198]
MDEIFVEIDDKKEIDSDIDKYNNNIIYNDEKPHHGKPITMIEVSPNGSYFVTYSKKDRSIVGWNVDYENEGPLKPEINHCHIIHYYYNVNINISVSNNKKIAYIYDNRLTIIDMNNNQKIKLKFTRLCKNYHYCTFNLKDEFIFCSDVIIAADGDFLRQKIIWIYSTQTKNNKWECKKIYKLPRNFELISISKYDQVYLFSKSYIYLWNISTEKSIKIFINKKTIEAEINKSYIRISSNEKFMCLRINDKIIIYLIELEIPIVTLNNGIQLYNFISNVDYTFLYLLLLPLLSNEIRDLTMKYCWKEYTDHLQKNDLSQNENQSKNLPIHPFLFDIKYAFGILNGYVWQFKLEETILKMNSSLNESNNEIIESLDYDSKKINKESYEHINIHLFDSYMGSIHESFKEIVSEYDQKNVAEGMVEDKKNLTKEVEIISKHNQIFEAEGKEEDKKNLMKEVETISKHDQINVAEGKEEDKKNLMKEEIIKGSIKWEIENLTGELKLQVFNKINANYEWNLVCTRTDKSISLYGKKLLSTHYILLLTEIGISIYHFNGSNISLAYFYYMNLSNLYIKKNEECDINDKDDKHKLVKKLQNYHKKVLSKSTLPLPNHNSFKFNEDWVSYVKDNKSNFLKYGVELLSFAIKEHNLELIDDIYKKCMAYFEEENNKMYLSIIASTIPLFNEYYPEYISKYSSEAIMIIDSTTYGKEYRDNKLHLCSFQCLQIVNLSRSILWTKFNVLMDNHAKIYWIFIVIQPLLILLTLPISPFLFVTFYSLLKYHIINDFSFYNNGFYFFYIFDKISKYVSAVSAPTPTITFMIPYIKFVNYPRDYNWLLEFIKPQSTPFVKTISKDIYKTWNGEALINFKWNTYGKYYYAIIWILFMALLGCFTSAATISQHYFSDNTQKQLLIASIILGFIHLSFEVRQIVYNPIKWIRNLWNIFDITAYLFSIFTSIYWLQTNERNVCFAHAFFILLSPEPGFSFEKYINSNDPNNPWNLAPTYSKVLDDGTTDSNPYIIQKPDENTNMFIDYRTALFAMYLLLTGDSSALSNWSYLKNPPLAILTFSFSFLIVVYLMNLFIGLLNNAIEKDNNRVSYLMQKAEILAEIELFYLLPHQRRWEAWFPEVMYYYADVDKTREEVKRLIKDGQWDTNEFPEMKKDLFKKLNIKNNPADEIDMKLLLEKIKNIEKRL